MAENLIDLRRRIASVKNTQKITQAMKTVSAAKLRRSVNDLNKTKPFMEKVGNMLTTIGFDQYSKTIPFFEKRKTGDIILVAVTSDKGLCGAFNSHIFRRVERLVAELQEQDENVSLVTIGKKVFNYFKKRDYFIKNSFSSVMSRLSYADALEISQYVQKLFLNEDIMRIDLVYTSYESASKQIIQHQPLFPLAIDSKELDSEDRSQIEYIFEPGKDEIFKALLPKYINGRIYQVLLESLASEHSARMVAMDVATRNATDMIRGLTLTMNKLRQASITKELLEIITATEALQQ